jgi:enoyl-CoA hydratase/carnithine racemase
VLDVVVAADDVDEVVAAVAAHPLAATALAVLLRGGRGRSVAEGLLVESSTYSALQGGPELRSWLEARARRPTPVETRPAVEVSRHGDVLELVLNRPERRNALNTRMRDELVAALSIAATDDTVRTVRLRGAGPAFCAGGDLDDFGTAPDPATAHLVRLGRSPAAAVHRVADRTVALVHGACVGAGIELPAFAARVVAHPDAWFSLPEVGFGLVPGSGGTVSVPRRIGRHRTAWLAITGRRIDAAIALEWGLVDQVDPAPFG